ncbi:hypothetical protein AAFF_G00166560 [Aldrovandia affinis]|uniref:Uncharacterized protein n=1 Tax=Aldrovandia affinis TaxID=143900 RepID=A0AAD7RMJ8_9TELE|nr:hypothetical protein AAFF_G00166560 [Aldrovandia affinis]
MYACVCMCVCIHREQTSSMIFLYSVAMPTGAGCSGPPDWSIPITPVCLVQGRAIRIQFGTFRCRLPPAARSPVGVWPDWAFTVTSGEPGLCEPQGIPGSCSPKRGVRYYIPGL